MKKLFITLAIILGSVHCTAQNYVLEGTTFKQSQASRTTKKDTLITRYTFEDSQGNVYPVIINKTSGSCYYWKKRVKKAGVYPCYLKPEDSAKVAREYGIVYKPRTRTKKQ